MVVKLTMKTDLQNQMSHPVVTVPQNDGDCRVLEMELYAGQEPWTVPEGATARLYYVKPDGTGGSYDALEDGSAAWRASGNLLTFTLVPQMFTAAGNIAAKVEFLLGEKHLNTFGFWIRVAHDCADEALESEDYFNWSEWTYHELERMTSKYVATIFNVVNPDMVKGPNGEALTTDSEKLQRCFDLLATSGGVISINREYTLTDNITIRHSSNGSNSLITVRGDSPNARINFASYYFQGLDTTTPAWGGVIFKDLRFDGKDTNIGFKCSTLNAEGTPTTNLIRLTFDNCAISKFTNFIHSDDYVQSVYFMGCYIRNSVGATIKSVQAMDLKIIGCVCEWGSGLIDVSQQMDGSSITDCCIEGYTDVPIILPASNSAVNISNSYFEENMGTSIDATRATENAGISICNNLFCEWRNGYEAVGIILLPASISGGNMIVMGNHHARSFGILLRVPDGAGDLSRVFAFGNNGTTNNTDKIKMLTPDDLNNVDVNLELGVDYWTNEDREQAVNEVVALASGGENWVFTMADGSTMQRVVPVGGADAVYTTETWTFTLVDGTTVTKGVAIV